MPPEGRTLAIFLNARVYVVEGRLFGDLPNLLDLLLELQRQAGHVALCVPVLPAVAPPRWTSPLPLELEVVPLPAYKDTTELIRRSYRLLPDLARSIVPRLREWDAVGGVAPSGFGLVAVLAALAWRRRAFLLVRGNVMLSLWGEHRGSLLRRLLVTGALLLPEGITRLLIRRGVTAFTFGPALAERYRGPRVLVLGGYARPAVAGTSAPDPLRDPDRLRRLLYVGRLTGEKGPDVLLRALTLLRDRVHGTTLTIIGDGAERGALADLAEGLGVSGQVEFVRYVGEAERLREMYLDAGIVVIPSRTEGIPGVLLEAMALGRVIVASGVGGMPSVLRSGETGVLVRPNDPAALADAIGRLLSEPEWAFRLAAAALAEGRRRTVGEEAEFMLRYVFGQGDPDPASDGDTASRQQAS